MAQEIISTLCPKCNSKIVVQKNWTPGGMNDYGGYVLECIKCLYKLQNSAESVRSIRLNPTTPFRTNPAT